MRSLEGCRVLDLGIITAGAGTTAILADLGAHVFKIESLTYKDPFRKWSGELMPGEDPDLPPYFLMTNRSKKSVGIDLKHAQGREVFLRLAAECDIVVENFSRGVLDRLGLDFESLKRINPRIILASISSQGDNGPDAAYVSFGSTLEATAGLAATTGYKGGPPVVSGIEVNYPDQVVAIFASAMIVSAWYARHNSPEAVHLDLSQRELTSFLSGEAFVDPSNARRRGNGQDDYVLQECLRTREGGWVAVSVRPDQVDKAVQLCGSTQAMSAWVGARDMKEALSALAASGIVAAPVLDAAGVLSSRNRSWSEALQTAPFGETVKGFLFRDAAAPNTIGPRATLIGEYTREVLTQIGHYSDAEIDALAKAGAIIDRNVKLETTEAGGAART